jgi:hypothetical protein
MSKDKKSKIKKPASYQQPNFYNDQLGENASEHFSDKYDNMEKRKKK